MRCSIEQGAGMTTDSLFFFDPIPSIIRPGIRLHRPRPTGSRRRTATFYPHGDSDARLAKRNYRTERQLHAARALLPVDTQPAVDACGFRCADRHCLSRHFADPLPAGALDTPALQPRVHRIRPVHRPVRHYPFHEDLDGVASGLFPRRADQGRDRGRFGRHGHRPALCASADRGNHHGRPPVGRAAHPARSRPCRARRPLSQGQGTRRAEDPVLRQPLA